MEIRGAVVSGKDEVVATSKRCIPVRGLEHKRCHLYEVPRHAGQSERAVRVSGDAEGRAPDVCCPSTKILKDSGVYAQRTLVGARQSLRVAEVRLLRRGWRVRVVVIKKLLREVLQGQIPPVPPSPALL